MANLTFYKYERLIQVDSPQTSIDIQDLINQIRLYEESLLNLDYGHIANAYGKQPLGGGAYIGITLELINNWRLSFEARSGPDTIPCSVSGGNLVAINSYNNNPIYPTAFTQVTIQQSSSPTIIQPDSNYSMLYLLESLRGRNRSVGTVYYWNPDTGSDSNDGLTPGNAVATFSKAQTLATAGAGDIIFAIASSSGGVTTSTEVINISKAGLKLRGPGYQFQLVPSIQDSDTVTISADSVEFEGFYIKTSAGSYNGITLTSDNCLIKNCWINSAGKNGVEITSASRTQIDTCVIEDCISAGIQIGTTTTRSNIKQCIISGNGENGVDMIGPGITDNIFENNLIFNNTGFGIDIGSGILRTGIRLNHTFSGNTLGSTRDLGTGTFIETPAGGASATEIADAVWDEVISGHITPHTAGKTLKDAKVRATIASLKR